MSGIERIETKREAIGAALAGFFGAGSVEEKLRWVRDPERVRPLMMDFYASHELKGAKWAGLGWSKSIAERGFRLGYVEAVFETGEPMALIVDETEEGRVKVDWESSVRYGELPWREFVQVNVQKRCSGSRHAVLHGLFDPGFIVQVLGTPKVNVKVAARERHAVAGNKVVFAIFIRFR